MEKGVRHIYFFQEHGAKRLIKIGITNVGFERLSGLRAMCPYGGEVLAYMKGTGLLESWLHSKFRASQFRNEWFLPSKELLMLISEIKTCGSFTGCPRSFVDNEASGFFSNLGSVLKRLQLTQGE